MSKFNFKNINYQKIGDWMMDMLRTNSGTIVGGLSMIGLAMLCRKLNIPYTVLTEPYTGRSYVKPEAPKTSAQILYFPSDAVEASIQAIYDGAMNADFDSQRCAAGREIMSIISARKNDISEATKTYAISYLRLIADEMDFDSGRKTIMSYISKIAKGEI
jgi:hypothetical protein